MDSKAGELSDGRCVLSSLSGLDREQGELLLSLLGAGKKDWGLDLNGAVYIFLEGKWIDGDTMIQILYEGLGLTGSPAQRFAKDVASCLAKGK